MEIRVKNEKYGHLQVELPNRTVYLKKGAEADVDVCPAVIDRLKTGVLVPVNFYGHETEIEAMVDAMDKAANTALEQAIDKPVEAAEEQQENSADSAIEQNAPEVKPVEAAKPTEQPAAKTGNGKPKLDPLPASNLPGNVNQVDPLKID